MRSHKKMNVIDDDNLSANAINRASTSRGKNTTSQTNLLAMF